MKDNVQVTKVRGGAIVEYQRTRRYPIRKNGTRSNGVIRERGRRAILVVNGPKFKWGTEVYQEFQQDMMDILHAMQDKDDLPNGWEQ